MADQQTKYEIAKHWAVTSINDFIIDTIYDNNNKLSESEKRAYDKMLTDIAQKITKMRQSTSPESESLESA